MSFSLVSCKARDTYKIEDYLNDLAIASGLSDNREINNNLSVLLSWGVIKSYDKDILYEDLNYDFLGETISNLIEEEKGLISLKNHGWVDLDMREKTLVSKQESQRIIDSAVHYINNKKFVSKYDIEYKDNVKNDDSELEVGDIFYNEETNEFEKLNEDLELEDAQFEEVYDSFYIEDSFEIDFSKSEVIPYKEEETSYVNNRFNLLSSKTHTFNSDGYRVSYSLNASNISVHISKNEKGVNVYSDISLSNVKPNFKWIYDDDNIKHAYFKIDFNSNEKLGCSIGKYYNYYLDYKELDSKNFIKKLKNNYRDFDDEIEASIPICTIKTPIPNVPTATINLEVLAKIYASGKAELQLYNTHSLGFETKDGKFRIINDSTKDYDAILSGSSKACLGLNISIDAVKTRLADVEFDGGLRAELKQTIHLYDDEGNMTSEESEIPYSTLVDISNMNNNVDICADVSLHWLFDITFNTYKTMMYKYGFTKKLNILDEDNQLFGNMHHIENGQFVKKCTRKNKKPVLLTTSVKLDKISLASYAEVIHKDETYEIVIKALPFGYKEEDIIYESSDDLIAYTNSNKVIALKPGSVKIRVCTSDEKYSAYVNILVSSE